MLPHVAWYLDGADHRAPSIQDAILNVVHTSTLPISTLNCVLVLTSMRVNTIFISMIVLYCYFLLHVYSVFEIVSIFEASCIFSLLLRSTTRMLQRLSCTLCSWKLYWYVLPLMPSFTLPGVSENSSVILWKYRPFPKFECFLSWLNYFWRLRLSDIYWIHFKNLLERFTSSRKLQQKYDNLSFQSRFYVLFYTWFRLLREIVVLKHADRGTNRK